MSQGKQTALMMTLTLAVSAPVGIVAGADTALAVLAGGGCPALVSLISLRVFPTMITGDAGQGYERFVMINFLSKIVLTGLGVTLILAATALPPAPYVISFVISFFIWHIYEAYQYQGHLLGLNVTKG